jgi:hypothetical protein
MIAVSFIIVRSEVELKKLRQNAEMYLERAEDIKKSLKAGKGKSEIALIIIVVVSIPFIKL